jgi:hypothetical protein
MNKRVVAGAALAAVAVAAAAALVPIHYDSREEVFAIPRGTWARRVAGDKREVLPSQIHLVIGVRDILVLRNDDDVPQTFGPTILMPGQTFRLPFTVPSENQFVCTAHASGQMTILVEAAPASPWDRLAFRSRSLLENL